MLQVVICGIITLFFFSWVGNGIDAFMILTCSGLMLIPSKLWKIKHALSFPATEA